MKILENKKIVIGVITSLLLLGLTSSVMALYFYNNKNEVALCSTPNEDLKEVKNTIHVDLKGEVNKPGVYEVEEGTIVNDLITLADGFTKNAYQDNINLSKKLTDEMVIVVSKKGSTITTKITNNASINTTNSNLININTASVSELMKLTGIGKSKAESIIKYREENGNFKTTSDITKVSGIGKSTYEKFKERITI